MFREMRRCRQMLSPEESARILRQGTAGVLALLGDEDYPYAVPLSYVYTGSKIYFHGAKSGHKLDAIRKCEKASFCVIAQDHVVPEEYTTYFRSVIAFGKIRVMDGEDEIRRAAQLLGKKYHPTAGGEELRDAIEKDWKPLCMLEFSIEHLSGKEAIELAREKQAPGRPVTKE